MLKKYNVGVLGAGRMGKIHIENILHSIPDLKLKKVADINIDNELETWAKNIGVPKLIKDPNEVINDPEINVIVIASSTPSHTRFIQEAARAKKDIFCEKPIDTDLTRIKKTLEIVREKKVKLMIGFNRRFDKHFIRVKELISSGYIGSPYMVKVTARDPALPSFDYLKSSGGMLIDMTIHDWDMARFQVGSEVEEIYTIGAALVDPGVAEIGDIDTVALLLKFKNGVIGMIDNSRQAVYGYDQRVEVFGSKGCAIADNESSNTVRLYNSENIKEDNMPYFFLQRYMDSYAEELRYFVECLQENKEPSPNGEDGLQNVVIAIAAQKSYEENRPVKIAEIVV
jgi:myo-inositol 2-dehydrogenase/D-chiro-inositol 1-dehydrogenase